MKKMLLAGLALALFSFSNCGDHCHHHGTCALDISYPAAYVVNGGDGTLSVIKLDDFSTGDEISLAGATFPHHIYLSPDRTTLAVAITSTDLSGGHSGHGTTTVAGLKVQIIDATTGEIHHEIAVAHLPHNAAWSADGSELWVSQSDTAGLILVFETGGFGEKARIAVGKSPSEITFSADGTKAFAANTGDATVSMIDAATKKVEKTIAVGLDPVGAWPGANGQMFVDNETGQSISVIDAASGDVLATVALGFKPGYAAWQAAREELWVTDATNGKAVVFKNESGSWTRKAEVATGADAHAIAFSADGKTAFVTNQGAATVSVLDVETRTKTRDVAVGQKPNGIVLKQ